jgi:hypothetical protein
MPMTEKMVDPKNAKSIKRETYASPYVPADTPRALYLGNPHIDNLMTTVVALGAEVWSTRRRLMVIEEFLAEKGITEAMIEAYVPSPGKLAQMNAARDAFVARTMHHLAREADMPISTDWTVKPVLEDKPKS